MLKSVLH